MPRTIASAPAGRGIWAAQKQKKQDFVDGAGGSSPLHSWRLRAVDAGDRPKLAEALAYCKRHKGTKLIVATLSRLRGTRDFS
jgi:hypothetical protein